MNHLLKKISIFFKRFSKIKKSKNTFPRFGEESHINLDIHKFLSQINPNLEILNVSCNYEKDKLHFANEWYFQCIKNLKI